MVFLVAEIGVNWDGDVNLVKEMVSTMKRIGFDAVKFQAYNEKIIGDHPEKDRLMKSAIKKDNIDSINDICKDAHIEWFCTPMYPEAVDLLEPYVSRFKIRVHDGKSIFNNQNSELLKRVFETKKEVIISSQISPKNIKFEHEQVIKWLYCVPSYPCKIEEVDFTSFKDFNGYSNHCVDISVPFTSAILGAEIIEVHVTADKTKDFVDNNVSFNYEESNTLVSLVRSSEKIRR